MLWVQNRTDSIWQQPFEDTCTCEWMVSFLSNLIPIKCISLSRLLYQSLKYWCKKSLRTIILYTSRACFRNCVLRATYIELPAGLWKCTFKVTTQPTESLFWGGVRGPAFLTRSLGDSNIAQELLGNDSSLMVDHSNRSYNIQNRETAKPIGGRKLLLPLHEIKE